MKESAPYVKIVEWSDEDQCFVGSCPGLLYGGCHGDGSRFSSSGVLPGFRRQCLRNHWFRLTTL